MDPISVHYSSTSSSHKSNKLVIFVIVVNSFPRLKFCYIYETRNPNWLNSLSPLLSSSSSPSSSEGLVNLTWVAALAHAQDASDDIDWNQIFFVRRHPIIRYSQLFIAVYGLVESLFYFYLSYNVISSVSFLKQIDVISICLY